MQLQISNNYQFINKLKSLFKDQSKLQYLLLMVVFLLSIFPGMALAEGQNRVSLIAQPDFSQIQPDEDLVKFLLKVTDGQGQPIKNARIDYQLQSPPKNKFLSTDFPIVEGTTLMEGSPVTATGDWSFDYLLPIRGEYRFQVKVSPTKDSLNFTPFNKEIIFNIHEKPREVRNAFALTGGLLLFGIFSGLVIGKSAAAKGVKQ